jgi:hypothetical protein
MRALVAALLLPLPFAALPVLSLWLGGGADTGRDYALTTNPGITREFVLTEGADLSDSDTPGEPFASTAYTPDGRLMAVDNGCGGGLAES